MALAWLATALPAVTPVTRRSPRSARRSRPRGLCPTLLTSCSATRQGRSRTSRTSAPTCRCRRLSAQRILLRQPDDKAGDAPGRRRTTGLALLARVVLSRGQSAVPGKQRRRRHGEDLCPAPPGEEPRQRREPQPVSRVVPDPADVAAEHRVLVPEHQQFSSLCPVTA